MEIKSLNDLKELEYIGSGTFGKVYKDDDKKLKIFHDEIKIDGGWFCKNPALKHNKIKNWLLIRRNKKILHTDLITDTIHINGMFKGTITKFQSGITLVKAHNELDFNQKLNAAHELITNVSELIQNNIYPLDLKLNNIVYDEDEEIGNKVRLIDLDDSLTRVTLLPSYRLQKKCLHGLKSTVINFFTNQTYECLTTNITERLGAYKLRRKYKDMKSFESIYDFLNQLEHQKKFLFIKDDNNMDELINKLLHSPYLDGFDIVLLLSKVSTKYINELLDKFESNGLCIFDVFENTDDDIYPFISDYNSNDYITYEGNETHFTTGVFVKKK